MGPDTVDDDMQQARALAWRNMSEGGRSQFAWPDPGMARLEDSKAFDVDKALIAANVRWKPGRGRAPCSAVGFWGMCGVGVRCVRAG